MSRAEMKIATLSTQLSKQLSTDSLVTMSGTITLFCWVINTPTDQIFPVKVVHDVVWGNVKDSIKEKKTNEFADIDADTLKLWKVRHCAISHVVAQLPIQKVTIGHSQRSLLESDDFLKEVTAKEPLNPIGPLSADLNHPVPDDRINIIIVQRSRRRCELAYLLLLTTLY